MGLQQSGRPQFRLTDTGTRRFCSVTAGNGRNIAAFRNASAAIVTAIPRARLPHNPNRESARVLDSTTRLAQVLAEDIKPGTSSDAHHFPTM